MVKQRMKKLVAILLMLTGYVNAADVRTFNDVEECEKLQREFAFGNIGRSLFGGTGPYIYENKVITFNCLNKEEKWYWHSRKPIAIIETPEEYKIRVAKEIKEYDEKQYAKWQKNKQQADNLINAK